MRKLFLAAVVTLLTPVAARAQEPPPDDDVVPGEIEHHEPAGAKPVVLVFLRRDCPVSGRYAPSIQQISRRYADRVAFWLVYPDKNEAAEAIRKSVAEYGYQLPVLRDPEHILVQHPLQAGVHRDLD